jgi:hypothetical protein
MKKEQTGERTEKYWSLFSGKCYLEVRKRIKITYSIAILVVCLHVRPLSTTASNLSPVLTT